MRSGLGLRFVRELEQGKETVRMDKVNIVLDMFESEAVTAERMNFPEKISASRGVDKILAYYRILKGVFSCIQKNKRVLHYGHIIKQSL